MVPSFLPSLLPERRPKSTTAPYITGQSHPPTRTPGLYVEVLSSLCTAAQWHSPSPQHPAAPSAALGKVNAGLCRTGSTRRAATLKTPRFHRLRLPARKRRSRGKAMHQPLSSTSSARSPGSSDGSDITPCLLTPPATGSPFLSGSLNTEAISPAHRGQRGKGPSRAGGW